MWVRNKALWSVTSWIQTLPRSSKSGPGSEFFFFQICLTLNPTSNPLTSFQQKGWHWDIPCPKRSVSGHTEPKAERRRYTRWPLSLKHWLDHRQTTANSGIFQSLRMNAFPITHALRWENKITCFLNCSAKRHMPFRLPPACKKRLSNFTIKCWR